MYGQPQPMYGQPMQPMVVQQPMVIQQPMVVQQPVVMHQPVYQQPGYVAPNQIQHAPPQQPRNNPPPKDDKEMNEMKKKLAKMEKQMEIMEEMEEYQEMSKKLDAMDGCYIREKFDLHEQLAGCELANTYQVYRRNKDQNAESMKKGKKQFSFKEKSTCMNRYCLSQECRPLDMKVINEQYGNKTEDAECMHLRRPCKCSFCCFGRQKMEVMWTEKGQQKYLGQVVDPWDFCNYGFEVQDENNEHLYNVTANCCQMAFWLSCTCESCNKIEFKITTKKHSFDLGSVMKTGPGCCASPADYNYNNFIVMFPKNITWKVKALFLSMVMLIDYIMFQKGGGKGRR